MRVKLEKGEYGTWVLRTPKKDGRDIFFQADWDRAPLASLYGWTPCEKCNATDGTVDCQHRTVGEMLSEAADWLEEHEGKWAEDPGYFDAD